MPTVYAITEDCPLGCGPVILVKRITDAHVFAWCVSCGLAWADPAKGTWEPGDLSFSEIHITAVADGSVIDFANGDDVERAGLGEFVAAELPRDKHWTDMVDGYNMKYGCER
jgi:hypothetical protein